MIRQARTSLSRTASGSRVAAGAAGGFDTKLYTPSQISSDAASGCGSLRACAFGIGGCRMADSSNEGQPTTVEKAPVVQSFNEWDPLEEVVVGTVLGATYP